MRKTLVASGLSLVAILAMALPASAASSSGASVSNESGCNVYPEGTGCYAVHSEQHVTNTPSGNSTLDVNLWSRYTLTRPAGTGYSLDGSTHIHALFKSGEQQVYSTHITNTSTATGQPCTFSYDYHYANGSVQFDDFTSSCS